MAKPQITPEKFFVLRTPRLPLTHLAALKDPSVDIWQHLSAWLSDDSIKLALYIASPSLLARTMQSYEVQRQGKALAPKQKNKLQQALLKYYIRMSSRPTPFGLFSGVNIGEVGPQTMLISGKLSEDKFCSRLDMFYLNALRLYLSVDENAQSNFNFIPNPSHYIIADQCRYIETYQSENTRQYRLSAIEIDEYSQFVLNAAKAGISFDDLVDKFLTEFSEQPEDDISQVKQYLQGMIAESILVPELIMPLTGEAPDNALLTALQNIQQRNIVHPKDTINSLTQGLQQALQATTTYF